MKKKIGSLIGIAMAGMLIVACGSEQGRGNKEVPKEESIVENEESNQESNQEENQEASQNAGLTSFEAQNLDGETVNQGIFAKADLTMVNVWATFCGPCLREMPELGELNEEYADQGVQVVGIVLDTLGDDGKISSKMVTKAKEAVEQTGAHYVHLLPSRDLLNAGIGEIFSVPTTFFVDSEGNLVGETYVGARRKAEWQDIIDEVKSSMEG